MGSHRLGVTIAGLALMLLAACGSDGAPQDGPAREPAGVTTQPTGGTSSEGPDTEPVLVDGASGIAQSGDLRIHYEVHGQGRPLVLVHGWAASIRTNWEMTGWLDELGAVRQVIAIDIRGHGDSDKPHDMAAYGYAAVSEDVIAVMDHLGVERADYVGYSLGAFVGASLMGHHPERFTSFVLIGIGDEDAASLALAPRIADALRAPTPEDISDPEALGYRTLVDLDPRNDREALALAALEMWPQGYPLELGGPALADVGVPVLIVNGADDPYAATDQAFVAAVPGAELVEIPDSDHLGVLVHPGFKEAVVGFLESN